jgi:hypothetical protein
MGGVTVVIGAICLDLFYFPFEYPQEESLDLPLSLERAYPT